MGANNARPTPPPPPLAPHPTPRHTRTPCRPPVPAGNKGTVELKGPASHQVHVPEAVLQGLRDMAVAGVTAPVAVATRIVAHTTSLAPGAHPASAGEAEGAAGATSQTFPTVGPSASDASLGTAPAGASAASAGGAGTVSTSPEAWVRSVQASPALPPPEDGARAASEDGAGAEGQSRTPAPSDLAPSEIQPEGCSVMQESAAGGGGGGGQSLAAQSRRLLRRTSAFDVNKTEPGTMLVRIRSGRGSGGEEGGGAAATPTFRRVSLHHRRCAELPQSRVLGAWYWMLGTGCWYWVLGAPGAASVGGWVGGW
jgi:hypothetical protein